MKNTVENSIPALLAMADQAAEGAGQLGATLPLTLNTKETIDTDIAALTNKIMEYGLAKNELSARRDSLDAKNEECRTFITVGRDNLKPILGSTYNEMWDVAGFSSGSLQVPDNPSDVLLVLKSLKDFIRTNADYEVPSKSITAEHGDDLHTELKAAIAAVNQQKGVIANILLQRVDKFEALQKRMRCLIGELRLRMDGLDGRWLQFGFNKPDAQETPEAVEHVQAALIGPTAVALKWDSTARAEYYHVFKRVQGVDQDYVLVGSPADLDFTIENLPTNAQIDIVVSAVNNGGEGQRSTAVTVTTH